MVADTGTIMLGEKVTKDKVEDDQGESDQPSQVVLVLVKPTIIVPEETEAVYQTR